MSIFKFEPEPIKAEDVTAYRNKTGAGMTEAKEHLRKINEAEAMILLLSQTDVSAAEGWLLMRHAEQRGYADTVKAAFAPPPRDLMCGPLG